MSQDLDEDDLLEGAEQAQKGEEDPGDPDALLGSHGAQYGGGSELLYDQFQLQSFVAKKHQTVLLEVSVRARRDANSHVSLPAFHVTVIVLPFCHLLHTHLLTHRTASTA